MKPNFIAPPPSRCASSGWRLSPPCAPTGCSTASCVSWRSRGRWCCAPPSCCSTSRPPASPPRRFSVSAPWSRRSREAAPESCWSSITPISSSTSPTASPCSISARRSPPVRRPRSARIGRWSVPILAAETLLAVRGLEAGYGKIDVLHGVDLSIGAGEIVALLGPNGAGKTTLLRAVSGLLSWKAGTVVFAGNHLAGRSPRDIAQAGLAHVIEGHRVFTQLSIADNLSLAGYDLPRGERAARIDEALDFFPEIAAKRRDKAGSLSGGPPQMPAGGRATGRRPAPPPARATAAAGRAARPVCP